MMTKRLRLSRRFAFFGGALAVTATAMSTPGECQSALPRGTVTFPDGTRVQVEIAADEPTRNRGLMFRTSLGPNEGMIFVFPKPGIYPFWMKNTLIPLDMLWVDAYGRIVYIASSVPPCKADPCPSYPPDAQAVYVVEVAAGFAREHDVKVGDHLKMTDVPKPSRDTGQKPSRPPSPRSLAR